VVTEVRPLAMPQSITEAFPTLADLERAPVHDVAAFVLNWINGLGQGPRFIRSNLITGLADSYLNDNTAPGTPHDRRTRAGSLVAEAVGYLFTQNFAADDGGQGVSGAHIVTRLGQSIKTREDFRSYAQASLLPPRLLRPDLAEIVLPLFLSGHYDDAVSAAFKRVEIKVRELGRFTNEDYGVDLMRAAFRDEGALCDMTSVPSERKALSHLFAGAIGFFKNPLSHRVVGIDDARMAASRILFANELIAVVHLQSMRIAESSGGVTPPPESDGLAQ
jgi:uncharacterized protein (TIGR02391 family)